MLVDPAKETYLWIDAIVVGLNLCPFASSVIKKDALHVVVCSQTEESKLFHAVLEQIEMLHHSNEEKISTTLLVFDKALSDFDHYLSFVDAVNDLLIDIELASSLQVASFHPNYCFDGVSLDDASNYSNRSPYPMLHFLRESQVSQALKHYPNPEDIPANNISTLRRLGKRAIEKMYMNNV